jgi:hypothetical protein
MSRIQESDIIRADIQSLQEIVDFISEGSVSISRYETVRDEKMNLNLLLNSIRYNISTLISSIQIESDIPFSIRNKYKTILNHINNMIENNR